MRIGLDHVHVFASDIAATVDFFRAMFGATLVWDAPAAGVRNVRLRLGDAFIQVYEQPHHVGIATDDLDGLVARMTAHGFAFRNPVRDAGDFRYVMVAGPDELLIELFEPRDPARWQIDA